MLVGGKQRDTGRLKVIGEEYLYTGHNPTAGMKNQKLRNLNIHSNSIKNQGPLRETLTTAETVYRPELCKPQDIAGGREELSRREAVLRP